MLVVILIVGPPQDALFGIVLLSNTAVGVVQELRAKRTLDRLVVIGGATATVIRSGVGRTVPSREVVEGDLVEVRRGDQIVVDGQLVMCDGLEVDESLLTGESEPVSKSPVLRTAVPMRTVAAAATFAGYALARDEGLALGPSRTVATLVLFGVGLWVLVIVARPLTTPKRISSPAWCWRSSRG